MRFEILRRLPLFASMAMASLLLSTSSAARGGSPGPGARLDLECAALRKVTGGIRSSQAVHADRDGRLDLLTHVGDRLVFISGPDPRQFSQDIGLTGVTSFTTMSSPGDLAVTMLVADSLGLAEVKHGLRPEENWSFVRRQAGPARWTGATALVVIDWDGDGDEDLVGLSADGSTLLRMERLPDGTWAEASDTPLGAVVRGLSEIQWAGSGQSLVTYVDEPAGDDTVVVMDLAGNVYSMITPGGAIDQLVVLDDRKGVDSIAVLSGHGVTVLREGSRPEATVYLPAIAPTGISNGDVNGDGRADLLMNSTTSDEVTVLLACADPSAAARFDRAASLTVALGAAKVDMSVQRAAPVAADFDRDGDVDVIQLLDATRQGVVGRGIAIDETAMHATLRSNDWILTPDWCSAFFSVALPPLPDGTAPDWLEVTLSSTVGARGARGVTSVIYTDVIRTKGSQVGDATDLSIFVREALGQKSSLLIRALGEGPSGGTVNRVGPEKAFGFRRTNDLARGSGGGGVEPAGEDMNGEEWPPLPPEPVVTD